MKVILLITKKVLNYMDNVLIDNLEKQNYKILITKSKNNINNKDYNYVIEDIYNLGIRYVIVLIIKNINDIKIKYNLLKNLYLGLNVVILSCGPTSKLTELEYKKLYENNIIICVKYKLIELNKYSIIPDFLILSNWMRDEKESLNIYNLSTNSITVGMLKEPYIKIYDICCRALEPGGTYNHKYYFNRIDNGIIEDLFFNTNFCNNILIRPRLHIMLELAIPLSIHLGFNKINTFGYDGFDKNLNYNYDDNKFASNVNKAVNDINKVIDNSISEYPRINIISKLLLDYKIKIYKCDKKSPINLDYNNIL